MKYFSLVLLAAAGLAACKGKKEDPPAVAGSWKLVQVQVASAWKPYAANHILTLTTEGTAANTGARDSLGIGTAYQRYNMADASRVVFRPANEGMSNLLSVSYAFSGDTLTFLAQGFAAGQRYLRQK
ncbi:hypothetical protein [Siphonobacter aquaeclarae]|uniref:Lipocalin-like domain-containing protein n=1 Tax=Siphonobacter aquaeclarae TaxID=563176 RepID=A0A1G9QF89_9BACT|nr:hypothetical protein [Siphonobacter aquaeclarae]SDM09698.1 hypothetical protein SAMN04488090_2609 [Siphonobacter aquaeclarae]